jgi:hypothetical protein
MALIVCPDCGKQVSDQAPACPHCGRPMAQPPPVAPKVPTQPTGTKCPKCGNLINPVVTNVGGGSCSVGSRERWTCPVCRQVIYRKGCFVATATYGDEDLIEVRLLRDFRDAVLSRSAAGRLFVRCYYRLAPYPAWVVERVPPLRRLARLTLDKIVVQIESQTSLNRDQYRR